MPTHNPRGYGNSSITVGSGPPTKPPRRVGEQYHDVLSRITYIAIQPGRVEYFEPLSTLSYDQVLVSDLLITLTSDSGLVLQEESGISQLDRIEAKLDTLGGIDHAP